MSAALQQMATLPQFTPEQVELIKKHYAKGAGDLELQLYFGIAQRMELDPFKGQCHYIRRRQKNSNGGYDERWTFQVSIDGYRAVAARTGLYAGQVGPHWCGLDGVWRDVWLDKSQRPMAARVGVMRRGFAEPLYAVALWADYGANADSRTMWPKLPEHMLAKVAEALALRRAFPNELGGTYTDDEMGQAERPAAKYIQVRGSHEAEVEAVVVGEKPVEGVSRASELPRIPEECSAALAECTTVEQVKEVVTKWWADAKKGGFDNLLTLAYKKREKDLTPAP